MTNYSHKHEQLGTFLYDDINENTKRTVFYSFIYISLEIFIIIYTHFQLDKKGFKIYYLQLYSKGTES